MQLAEQLLQQSSNAKKAAAKRTPAKPRAAKKPRRAADDDDDDEDVAPPPSRGASAVDTGEGKRVMRKRAAKAQVSSSSEESDESDGERSPPPPSEPRAEVTKAKRAEERQPWMDEKEEEDPNAQPVSEVTHILPCVVSRAILLKHVDEPYFADMIHNCFVRVVGKQGSRSYVLGQVPCCVVHMPSLSWLTSAACNLAFVSVMLMTTTHAGQCWWSWSCVDIDGAA